MFEDIILLTTYKNIKKIIFNHIDILIDVRIIFLDARKAMTRGRIISRTYKEFFNFFNFISYYSFDQS